MASATPRRPKASSGAPVVEAPITTEVTQAVEAVPAVDEVAMRDAQARALLLTPEAKAEAKRFRDAAGIAFDLPHQHAAVTLGLIADRFATEYPTMAAADALVDGFFVRGIRHLTKITRKEVPTNEEFGHYLALIVGSHLTGIVNGVTGSVKGGHERDRACYVRDRKADAARNAEAAKRTAGGYVRGQATSATEDRDLAAAPIFDAVEMGEIDTYRVASPPMDLIDRSPADRAKLKEPIKSPGRRVEVWSAAD